jgi:hypothetical protein
VPKDLKGELTAKLTFAAEPFKVTTKETKFTIK